MQLNMPKRMTNRVGEITYDYPQPIPRLLSGVSYVLSLFIVAYGQPAWIACLSPVAAAFGYALLWISCSRSSLRQRFWLASSWFACVHLVQLSWMTSIDFQGYYILWVYVILCGWLGVQFGLLTLLVKTTSWMQILAAASFWTVLEWARLFVLCGFSWNPVGLALSSYLPSLQFASLWGIYGLSFWVILVNLAAVKAYFSVGRQRIRAGSTWFLLALVPTLFGLGHLNYQARTTPSPTPNSLSIALVQTGLLPSQKVPLPGRRAEFIAPYDQWRAILQYLRNEKRDQWDLIVLPEAVVPVPAYDVAYPYAAVVDCLKMDPLHLPPLQPPYAEKRLVHGEEMWCVSNAFWGQAIANLYQAEVVIGLDHHESALNRNYNAAFHFFPLHQEPSRYDKRILLPLAEYLPWPSLKFLTRPYGISEFFSQGAEVKVVQGKVPLSLSICYEETFADLIREGCVQGAELLVNVTNDNYYPDSRLPQQHFSHARLRAVENGIPLVRACNTGITAVVDRCGRVVAQLGDGSRKSEWLKGVLPVYLPLEIHTTLYGWWGDAGIIGLCSAFLITFFRLRNRFFVK